MRGKNVNHCVVLVAIVAWMQKGSTTFQRNIFLALNSSIFHEKNLAPAKPWLHSSLLLLSGQVDPRAMENSYSRSNVKEKNFVLQYH